MLEDFLREHATQLTPHMLQYVKHICQKGLDAEACVEAMQDALKASGVGVNSEVDFKTFFYIEHFVNLEAEELTGPLGASDQDALIKFMFDKRTELDFSNLTSYRTGVLLWLQSKNLQKAAYPEGGRNPFIYKKYNLEEWKRLVVEINKLVSLGIDADEAVITMAKELDDSEQMDFKAWHGFNFGINKNLYNTNKQMTRGDSMIDQKLIKVATVFEEGQGYWAIDVPKPKSNLMIDNSIKAPSIADHMISDQKAADMNVVKTKMINRTFAIDKLLEKYRDIFNEEQIDQIEDALNNLRKKMRKLKTAHMIHDIMIKTAGIFKNHQFIDGAEALISLAAPPRPSSDESEPTGGGKERSINDLTKEDLAPLLEKLYDVSVRLKRRNIIREIAEIDLSLYNLNVSSLFSELSDAQAKLIEAFGYASNKVEDVIPKLRSISMAPPPEANVSEEVAQELNQTTPKTVEKPTPKAPAAPPAPVPKAPTAPAPIPPTPPVPPKP